ncbi:MAG TPA: choice-of-anchor tandem repeat GloVer-containing protein [Verrucomicrobiae bacterium]
MTSAGGINGNGTVFALNTDGTGFTNLYNFNGDDGDHSLSGLILSENTLYGATYFGGTGDGNIFALSLGSIPLNIQTSGSNMVLTWGNPAFSLQAARTTADIYTNVPGAASPYTNTITGSQMFFRLQANSP